MTIVIRFCYIANFDWSKKIIINKPKIHWARMKKENENVNLEFLFIFRSVDGEQ